MRIVLDTNILVASVNPNSMYYPVFESFLDEAYFLCVTTDILLEYEEILSRNSRPDFASTIVEIITNAPNTIFINRYYEWQLIYRDPDDNKFVDCAIAGNAKLIVTEDRHFNVLKQIDYPKVATIRLEPFIIEELGKEIIE